MPGHSIVASSDIIPEFREFERTSTAVLVGYLKPIFERYTSKLVKRLEERSYNPDKLLIMNSAGGLTSASAASERPHTLVESGPAAGVIAAAFTRPCDGRNLTSFHSIWGAPPPRRV